jgi:Gpi18-like mannosyltransferase
VKIIKRVKKTIENISFLKIVFLALLLRLIFLPFFFHGDLNNHAIWGIYAQQFGFRGFYDWLNFGNYAWPNYPPFSLILFYLMRLVWQLLFNFFWIVNIKISYFPSLFIHWFENYGYLMILKIPAILADLGIGYLIYRYFEARGKKNLGKISSTLFLFNPAVVYLSSFWGQIESVITFFVLLSVVKILENRNILGIIYYFLSLMFKVTTVVAFPLIFITSLKRKVKIKDYVFAGLIVLLIIILTSYLFIDKNYFWWFLSTYIERLVPGPETLPYITVNAFNFWTILFGTKFISDSTIFLGVSLKIWAYLISSAFFILILVKYLSRKDIFYPLILFFFAAFLFLPRMHERYLYPIFALFPFVLVRLRGLLKFFLLISIIFLLNLYHGWWAPRIDFLVNILQVDLVERSLSFLNFLSFGFILKKYSDEKI